LRGRSILECVGRGYMDKYKDPTPQGLLLHTLALETWFQEIAEDIESLCEGRINIIAKKYLEKTPLKRKLLLEHSSEG